MADRRSEISQALTAVKSSHHPEAKAVQKEAEAELAYFDKLVPPMVMPNQNDIRNIFKKPQIEARRTQKWFHALTAEDQDDYCTKFPGTRFRFKRRLTAP